MSSLLALALALVAPAAAEGAAPWTFTARQVDKQTQYAVTGHPRPDARAQLRPGLLSLRCSDKDKRLKALYITGTPGEGAPLLVSVDDREPVLYYAEWETKLSARMPVARLLEVARAGRVLTIAFAGSPEHYDLPPLAAPLAQLASHCDFPALAELPPPLPPISGKWTRRGAVAADGSTGVLLSLKGDNNVVSLRVRCRRGDAEVYMAGEAGNAPSRNRPVALQFDAGPVTRAAASSGTDGRALYLAKPRDLLRELSGHARLNATFESALDTPLVESFDLAGFDETVAPWSGACGLRK